MDSYQTPAHQLAGKELDRGWKVIERIKPPERFSGGWNSVSYLVQSTAGEQAFLKAFDYRSHLTTSEPAEETYKVTKAYLYERDMLLQCQGKGLNHIVRILDHGKKRLDDNDPFSLVQYLILEKADTDIRPFVGHKEKSKLAWTLKMMHQATVATQQLHSKNIAHQDIKPGNLLVFNRAMVKLGDLGSSTQLGNPSPYDDWPIAGDSRLLTTRITIWRSVRRLENTTPWMRFIHARQRALLHESLEAP